MTELEKAQKVSKIKRINERMAEIGRKFGKDSGIYRDYKNSIMLSIPEDALTGAGTISRSEKTLDKIPDYVLNDLLMKHTAGEVMKEARKEAAEESKLSGRPISVEEYLGAQDFVYNLMVDDPRGEIYEAFQIYWDAAGDGAPRPSYVTLRDIILDMRSMDNMVKFGYPNEAQNIEDRLYKTIKARNERYSAAEVYFE